MNENMKLRFLTVGYVEIRKGQDVLVEAIKKLPDEIRVKCEFLLVGQDSSLFALKLKEDITDIPEIRMIGIVDREELHRIFEVSDILIIPSREDPMPTVAAEAMMHSIPCIISDVVGTAAYITDGIDGWIFKSGDIQDLAQKVEWCFLHRKEIIQAGENARILYQTVFSMNIFERNLLALVDEVQM